MTNTRILTPIIIFLVFGCEASLNYSSRPGMVPNPSPTSPTQQNPPPGQVQSNTLQAKQDESNRQQHSIYETWQTQQEVQRKDREQRDYWQRQYAADTARLGDTCKDTSELERIAGTIPPSSEMFAWNYRQQAKVRRDRELIAITGSIQAASGFTEEWFAEANNPDDPVIGQTIEKARAAIKDLNNCDALKAEEATRGLDQTQALVNERAIKEKSCRESPKCMKDRAAAAKAAEISAAVAELVPAICYQIGHKRELLEILAEERSNPSGVVNLRDMHETGVAIQFTDARIREGKADFSKRVHKPFSEAFCKDTLAQ